MINKFRDLELGFIGGKKEKRIKGNFLIFNGVTI